MEQDSQQVSKKTSRFKNPNPKWIKETTMALIDKRIEDFSNEQIRILRNLYLENLRDGMKPKQAMSKAIQVISCFKL